MRPGIPGPMRSLCPQSQAGRENSSEFSANRININRPANASMEIRGVGRSGRLRGNRGNWGPARMNLIRKGAPEPRTAATGGRRCAFSSRPRVAWRTSVHASKLGRRSVFRRPLSAVRRYDGLRLDGAVVDSHVVDQPGPVELSKATFSALPRGRSSSVAFRSPRSIALRIRVISFMAAFHPFRGIRGQTRPIAGPISCAPRFRCLPIDIAARDRYNQKVSQRRLVTGGC